MEVCYFGTYEKDYPVNRIIIKGLKKNGIDVKECHISLWEKHKDKHGKFLNAGSLAMLAVGAVFSYFRLAAGYFSKHRNSDIVMIGYIGQLDIIFFRLMRVFLRKKPKIVFVPLVSLYDTAIVDRGFSGKKGLFAKLLYFIDRMSFRFADIIVLDTNEHIKYVSGLFGIDKKKFRRVWVGADEEIFYPMGNKRDSARFTVLFFGKYIPLHGIEYIIEAAKLLESDNMSIKMVGNGQLYEKMLKYSQELRVDNIDFVEWIAYNDLVREINNADVVLGIFGGSDKSSRVIPNKVFQAIACKKAVITGDSPAIRELFADGENILLCENRDPESLRNCILKLKNDSLLKNKIAESGYARFMAHSNSAVIGNDVKIILNACSGI